MESPALLFASAFPQSATAHQSPGSQGGEKKKNFEVWQPSWSFPNLHSKVLAYWHVLPGWFLSLKSNTNSGWPWNSLAFAEQLGLCGYELRSRSDQMSILSCYCLKPTWKLRKERAGKCESCREPEVFKSARGMCWHTLLLGKGVLYFFSTQVF